MLMLILGASFSLIVVTLVPHMSPPPSLSEEFQALPASKARLQRSCAGAALQERVRVGRRQFHPDAGRPDEREPCKLQRPVRVQLPRTGPAGGHLSVSEAQV